MDQNIWKRIPSEQELESFQPWFQIHNFGNISNKPENNTNVDQELFSERISLFLKILRVLTPYVNSKNLFELGCASGLFCFEAALAGWQVTGIEPREIYIKQANFVKSLLTEGISAPDFIQGSDETINKIEQTWDIGSSFSAFQYVLNPIGLLSSFSTHIKKALILETVVYLPSNPKVLFQPGDNWIFQAPCQLSNLGAIPHNKKSIYNFALRLSLPALAFGLNQVGFERIAYIIPPSCWRTSSSRYLRGFSTGKQVILVALKPDVPFDKNSFPSDWFWLTQPPQSLNYDFRGPFLDANEDKDQKNSNMELLGKVNMKNRLGRILINLGQRLIINTGSEIVSISKK